MAAPRKWTKEDETSAANQSLQAFYSDIINHMNSSVRIYLVPTLLSPNDAEIIKKADARDSNDANEQLLSRVLRSYVNSKLHIFIKALAESGQSALAKKFTDKYFDIRTQKEGSSIEDLLHRFPDLPSSYRKGENEDESGTDEIYSPVPPRSPELPSSHMTELDEEKSNKVRSPLSRQVSYSEKKTIVTQPEDRSLYAGNHDARPAAQSEKPEENYVDGGSIAVRSRTVGGTPSDHEDRYPMRRNPRGIALIINITKDRKGSDNDGKAMEELFRDLKFKTYLCPKDFKELGYGKRNNPETCTVKDIRNVLDMFITPEERPEEIKKIMENLDCFVLFLMGHGENGIFSGSAGKKIRYDEIMDEFETCENLKGKPKLFFIQSCRGAKQHSGYQTDSLESDSMRDIPLPSMADTLIAHSTVAGYESLRDPKYGSWFVQEIKEVFEKHWEKEHVVDMLTKVRANVNEKCKSPNGKGHNPHAVRVHVIKQCTETIDRLRKKLYF